MKYCTEDTCTHIIINSDATRTCGLYGVCFGQKLCDVANTNGLSCGGGGHSVGTVNDIEYTFDTVLKRKQEIENIKLDEKVIHVWVCELLPDMNKKVVFELSRQIKTLWCELVSLCKQSGTVIHRKDKRCVTVAIISSLASGLSARSGPIVASHGPRFQKVDFNKRSSKLLGDIDISDIRAGQRIMKKVFLNVKCVNRISV